MVSALMEEKTVVDDGSIATVPLRYNSHRGQAKVGQVADQIKGENNPELLFDHVGHLVAKKLVVVFGGLMATAMDGVVKLLWCPRWCFKEDGDAVGTDPMKQRCSRVGQVANGGRDLSGAALGGHESRPGWGGKKGINSARYVLTKTIRLGGSQAGPFGR